MKRVSCSCHLPGRLLAAEVKYGKASVGYPRSHQNGSSLRALGHPQQVLQQPTSPCTASCLDSHFRMLQKPVLSSALLVSNRNSMLSKCSPNEEIRETQEPPEWTLFHFDCTLFREQADDKGWNIPFIPQRPARGNARERQDREAYDMGSLFGCRCCRQ